MENSRYKQEAWQLDDLFPGLDSPELKAAFQEIENKVQRFEAYRGELSADMDDEAFMDILKAYEALYEDLTHVAYFAHLNFAADTQNQKIQSAIARVAQLSAEANNRTLFFTLWWKSVPDETAERLMRISGGLQYWLEQLRKERPYTLTEAEERIVNLKNVNGSQALLTLFSSITNRYTFDLQVNGETKELTYEELTVYYRDQDPDMREAAYQALFKVYSNDAPILGQIYQFRVRDWYSENVQLRKFESPLAVRNLANDIPDDVVDILLDVCRKNAPLFQRYFRLKARWLGMEKLRRYDVYGPVVKTQTRYDFADAVDLVLTSFGRFSPQISTLAERVFQDNHLDSEVRKGKQGGAFCATVGPDLTPYVLQSYNGRPADVATLAHELGHAVHAMLAEHHSGMVQQASLPLAETASTFGELLVIDRLLSEDPDPETQRDLLFRQMDTNYATIMRQAYFAIFERDAHAKIQSGASIDELSTLYAENLAEQFGNALDIGEEFRHEWVLIPHIYSTPFYVYAYAFGQLLVLSLYQQFLEEGEAFKPRYIKLLSAGGAEAPVKILEAAGIDIHTPEFWQGGFDVLETALERLEALEVPEMA
ncbi:MAG: M3 family oligoendopeptidase [Candidatus Promineifilaceae bacterium]